MKILSNLLLCVLVLCALSCSKDETQLDLESLNGSWEVIDVKCDDGVFSTQENGVSHGGAFIFTGKNISTQLHFFEDGSFEGNGTYTQVFTTMRQGQIVVSEAIRNDLVSLGTWEKNYDFLELTHNDFQQLEITEMSGINLVLKFSFDETEEKENSSTQKIGTVFYTLRRM